MVRRFRPSLRRSPLFCLLSQPLHCHCGMLFLGFELFVSTSAVGIDSNVTPQFANAAVGHAEDGRKRGKVVLVAWLDVAGCKRDLEGSLHSSMPRRAPGPSERKRRDVVATVRVRGANRAGMVHNRSHPAAESWRRSVGNWESPVRNAAFAGDAACILVTWFSSVRDVCDGIREHQLMLYGPVWLGMSGRIPSTSFDLSPATSFGNAAFTAPCGPTLALRVGPWSRASVIARETSCIGRDCSTSALSLSSSPVRGRW